MIGAGTKDLAQGLAKVATSSVAARGSQAIWVLDKEGVLLASGGAVGQDGDIEFALVAESLEVVGLPPRRVARKCLASLAQGDGLWIVVTDDAGEDEGALDSYVGWFAELFQREALREHEAEDTTEHLLSCFEQIRAVHDLADRLPGCETVDEMAKLCLESLLLALGVRLAVIVMRTEGRDVARGLFMGEQGKKFWTVDIPVSPEHPRGPIDAALGDGKVRYGSIESFNTHPGTVEAEALDWLLVVPICFGSEPDQMVLGSIVLMDRDEPDGSKGNPFGNPEAELAQSVGVLLGLALGTRLRASAEKELQIARSIQKTLIPVQSPSWPGIEIAGRNKAANQVGGDYFDYLQSSDGRAHLVIADVSGHNMASAMAMVMARSQLKAVVSQESEPSLILGTLATGLYEDLVRNELFITSFMLTLVDREEGETSVRFTNAGHNPPLLRRADGNIEWLDGGGPMIGFLPSVEYEERELSLSEGDVIVLYTDGVTEVANSAGEMLDESGLAEVVDQLVAGSATDILDGIFKAVDRHAASVAEDDVTVVVIKTTGSGGAGPDSRGSDERNRS